MVDIKVSMAQDLGEDGYLVTIEGLSPEHTVLLVRPGGPVESEVQVDSIEPQDNDDIGVVVPREAYLMVKSPDGYVYRYNPFKLARAKANANKISPKIKLGL